MNYQASTQASSGDRALAIVLATFSMFVVGYTASRVFLSQSSGQEATSATIPHQAEMWSVLGQ